MPVINTTPLNPRLKGTTRKRDVQKDGLLLMHLKGISRSSKAFIHERDGDDAEAEHEERLYVIQ